jgi:predicted aldo/keto reductase-like oxidoreductase
MISTTCFPEGGAIENAPLALRYVLSQPGILVIPGVESPELFDRNWQVFQEGQALSDADREEIEKIRQAHDKVFCRRCDYCQPCTQEIPIQIVMGFKYMVKRMGKGIFEHPLFSSVIQKARTCTECGACLPRCPYELPIPELIKENMRWVDSVR